MRYINIKRLEERGDWPPQRWKELASRAEEELRNLPEGKTRADVFKKYSNVWSMLKEDFSELSYGKCWYCEVSTDGMRGDMDHHRPKGKVTDSDHPGYWWLAFNWRNFRYSCERCNSKDTDDATGIIGGKGNEFPLVDGETRRKWHECDYEDLLEEDPLLLDPIEPGDPQLLSFNSDGRPGAAIADETAVDYQRVQVSIRVYNLYHSVSNRRRREIYCRVRDLVAYIRKYQSIWQANRSDLSARACVKKALDDLRRLIAPEAEYSAAARAYLGMFRKDGCEWAWVDRLLTAA
jgi:uncharacterized protein (TIGR02646 family)